LIVKLLEVFIIAVIICSNYLFTTKTKTMEQENFMNQMEEEKLPSTLNVLTILTFIGSAFGLISSIWEFIGVDKRVVELEAMMNDAEKMAQMPAFMKGMFSKEMLDIAKLQAANKIPMIIIGLISAALCIMGALQMRKQKMQGYYMWLIGEVLPFIGVALFISFKVFTGFALFAALFPVIFIILYTVQRKHLTK
jgi:hypothetical protein